MHRPGVRDAVWALDGVCAFPPPSVHSADLDGEAVGLLASCRARGMPLCVTQIPWPQGADRLAGLGTLRLGVPLSSLCAKATGPTLVRTHT